MSINFPSFGTYDEEGQPIRSIIYTVTVGYPLEDEMQVYLTTLETYGSRDGKIFFHTVDGKGITLYESKIESIAVYPASEDETIDAEDSMNDAAFMSDKPTGLWIYTERPTIRGLIVARLRAFWEDFKQI